MDLKALRAIEGIDAILLMSQAGSYGGYALADILTGRETPSGHLTASWPVNYEDSPCADRFSYLDGDLDEMIDALIAYDQAELLKAVGDNE